MVPAWEPQQGVSHHELVGRIRQTIPYLVGGLINMFFMFPNTNKQLRGCLLYLIIIHYIRIIVAYYSPFRNLLVRRPPPEAAPGGRELQKRRS